MERWLLTYADMITLLLALFIVLWSISSVNISKFDQLKASLHQALNGKVIAGSSALLSGGAAVLSPQGTQVPTPSPSATLDISQPGVSKHLRVLEQAGLVARTKEGRVVSCELSAEPIRAAADWVSRYEKFWTDQLDSLARYLYQQEELQRWNPPVPQKSPSSSSSAATRSPRKKSGAPGRSRKR